MLVEIINIKKELQTKADVREEKSMYSLFLSVLEHRLIQM